MRRETLYQICKATIPPDEVSGTGLVHVISNLLNDPILTLLEVKWQIVIVHYREDHKQKLTTCHDLPD
jgi:hypothetical protein